jgi:hypothetical protein
MHEKSPLPFVARFFTAVWLSIGNAQVGNPLPTESLADGVCRKGRD